MKFYIYSTICARSVLYSGWGVTVHLKISGFGWRREIGGSREAAFHRLSVAFAGRSGYLVRAFLVLHNNCFTIVPWSWLVVFLYHPKNYKTPWLFQHKEFVWTPLQLVTPSFGFLFCFGSDIKHSCFIFRNNESNNYLFTSKHWRRNRWTFQGVSPCSLMSKALVPIE